ncbi:MAG TPA: dicarboxylate/amino acid:cation symporter, partial [Gammaproteobacteria bacterium]
MKKIALHWQILIALVLAAVAGLLTDVDTAVFGVSIFQAYDFIGTLFINALKMLIVPLVASAMIHGISNIGTARGLGRLGGRTVLYYLITMVTAVIVAVVLVNLVNPGLENGQPVGHQLGLDARAADVAEHVKGGVGGGLASVALSAVPDNIVQAAADNEMLALIFFSILFAYFMLHIKSSNAEVLRSFWEGVFEVMMLMTTWVMKFAPIGVFGLVAEVVTETGLEAAKPLAVFAITVLAALAFHALVTLPLMLRFIARVNPWRYLQAVSPALLTAFSTASSNATLPINMECVEKNVGVSNRTTSFVLPMGATINMDGTALYECAAALFLIQAYGVDLSLGTQV